jgi:hypothetical protein
MRYELDEFMHVLNLVGRMIKYSLLIIVSPALPLVGFIDARNLGHDAQN